MQALHGRTKNMAEHVAKIAESQTMILAKFTRKPVEDNKIMISGKRNIEELDKRSMD